MDQTLFSEDGFHEIIDGTTRQFNHILRKYDGFHLFFCGLIFIELLSLLLLLPFFLKSALLALSLALFFLTLFVYFILRVYFQAHKTEQFRRLVANYGASCQEKIDVKEGASNKHTLLSHAYIKFAEFLTNRERSLYHPPNWLDLFSGALARFSQWMHAKDFYQMREMLLVQAVKENIFLVKNEPMHVEAHASLANAYIHLSSFYRTAKELEEEPNNNKFCTATKRAVEEFKIIQECAPSDPWVHAQLAYSYHDLQMPAEEIQEYEILLHLDPEDLDTLFKLGTLYFEQGMNVQGLRTYEQLLQLDPVRSAELIKYYGQSE